MRRLLALTAFFLTALFVVAVAHGELVQSGSLRLSFNGRLAPKALPRDRPAPVNVTLSGSVISTDGKQPPRLRSISIGFNRYGKISTAGLPTCNADELQSTTTEGALGVCKPALVGHGRFGANVDFPGRAPLPVEGQMLAFNGTAGGKPVILMHIYGSNPVQATFVLTFRITHRKGIFGTVFSTKIPKIASDLGYVTDIDLTFGRKYRYKGEPRSFLSASCSAPAGFPIAPFLLAQGSFSFANGQTLATTLARTCRVR